MNRYITSLGLVIILLLIFNHVQSQEKCLLVVDVQNRFYDNTALENDATEMVENINLIIDNTKPENVVYIKANGKILTVSLKGIKANPMERAPELDSNLKIVNKNIFTKIEGDAFTLENLNKFLAEHNFKEIVIVGLLAEKCVYSTALGGISKGYGIYIVPEAIVSKSENKKAKVIGKLQKKGVKILPISDLINAR